LRKSVDESIDEYIDLSRKVFEVDQVRKGVVPTGDDQCRFDYRKLENAVKTLVERKLQNANAVMADTHSQKIPTFVVATKGLHADGPPTLFRSYQCTGYNADKCAIWEAARATSALPLFFKPIRIKTPVPGSTYVDGGLAHNNPAEVALSEAQRLWASVKTFSLVSVGTGRLKSVRIVATNTNQSPAPKTSTLENLIRGPTSAAMAGEIALTKIRAACIELAFNSEHVHQRLLTLSASVDPEKRFPYHRFNVERDMHEIELHEWDAMELLGAHTTSYMEEIGRELKRNECVHMLINPPYIQCKTTP
jgi:predicted acylesterase/phospholipase RssA